MSNIKFDRLPHEKCRVTSAFGYRVNPITGVEGAFHQGIDFGAMVPCIVGDKLYAVAAGKVVYAADMMSTVYGYGHFMIIEHDGFCTLYSHMLGHIRKVNEYVKAGDIVGYMGSTGASTAAHLHFEVQPIKWTGYLDYIKKNAEGVRMYAVDPYPYVIEYRNRLEVDEEVANEIVRYKNISEMPTYYQAEIKNLVDRGIIKGNNSGELNMTEDMVRGIIISHRDAKDIIANN